MLRRRAEDETPSWFAFGENLFKDQNPFKAKEPVKVPTTTPRMVESLTDCMAATFRKNIPRLDVEFPSGFRLGFEGVMDELHEPLGRPSAELAAWGDRELAAVFLLLFGEKQELAVAFRTDGIANVAKRSWQTWGKSSILSFGKGKKAKRSFSAEQQIHNPAEDFREAVDASGCSVLVVVAPRAEQLRILNDLDEKDAWKNNICIVLLNARLRGGGKGEDDLRKEMADAYNPAFHLRFAGRGGEMLYRSATKDGPTPWVVARLGAPNTTAEVLLEKEEMPTAESVAAALSVAS